MGIFNNKYKNIRRIEMELLKDTNDNIYYCVTTYEEKDIPKNAGFKWNGNRWQTAS